MAKIDVFAGKVILARAPGVQTNKIKNCFYLKVQAFRTASYDLIKFYMV